MRRIITDTTSHMQLFVRIAVPQYIIIRVSMPEDCVTIPHVLPVWYTIKFMTPDLHAYAMRKCGLCIEV